MKVGISTISTSGRHQFPRGCPRFQPFWGERKKEEIESRNGLDRLGGGFGSHHRLTILEKKKRVPTAVKARKMGSNVYLGTKKTGVAGHNGHFTTEEGGGKWVVRS